MACVTLISSSRLFQVSHIYIWAGQRLKNLWLNLSTGLWRLVKGVFQWYFLWFFNAKFMVCVAGVVFREDGKVLLLRHRYWTASTWGLPGGIMEPGETVQGTLQREVKEECGYEIDPLQILSLNSGFRLRIEVFLLASVLGGMPHLDEREIIEAAFFDPEKLPDGVLETHAEMVRLALRSRG